MSINPLGSQEHIYGCAFLLRSHNYPPTERNFKLRSGNTKLVNIIEIRAMIENDVVIAYTLFVINHYLKIKMTITLPTITLCLIEA